MKVEPNATLGRPEQSDMTLLRLTLVVVLGLLAGSLRSPAQIRELWHRDFTATYADPWGGYESETNFVATIAAVDWAGNTLVAGSATCPTECHERGPMIAKLTPSGEVAWIHVIPTELSETVHTLALNPAGTAFLGARLGSGPTNGCALIAVDANGAELWRHLDTNGDQSVNPPTSVKVDAAGNVVWLHLRRAGPAYEAPTELLLSKYTSTGHRLWDFTLPGDWYLLPNHGLVDALCLGPDGCSYITGEQRTNGALSGIVAKVSPAGELLWFRRTAVGEDRPLPAFRTVALASNGNVCVAGENGYAVLSGAGDLLRFGTYSLRGDIVSGDEDGGFLLSQETGSSHLRLDEDGRVLWHTPLALHPSYRPDLGSVQDETTGWLTARVDWTSEGLRDTLTQIDRTGCRRWSAVVTDRPPLNPMSVFDYRLHNLARAPDGTYRLALNLALANCWAQGGFENGCPAGISVIAFALDEPMQTPRIVRPPAPVAWDGTNDVEFSVVAEGSGPLQYQWRHMDWPVPGATEGVWRIPSKSVPAYRGFVSVQVSDTNGTVLSAGVNLSCGRVWIEPPPADAIATQSFTAMSDVDVPVRVESSTDLVHWGPMAGVFDSYAIGLRVDYNAAAATFFRAIPVPPMGAAHGGKADLQSPLALGERR